MSRTHLFTLLFVLLTSATMVTIPASARADIDITGSLAGGVSNRDDDGVGIARLRGRYGLRQHLSVALTLDAGAAQNDDRTIAGFSVVGELGKTMGRWRPSIGLGLLHQHETAREDAEDSPITVTLGFDEAIRHRTGAEASVGTTLDVVPLSTGMVFAAARLTGQLMFDKSGPRSYLMAGLGLGYRF